MNPGDLVALWFPFSRQEAGQAQWKKRPVLVLSRLGFGLDEVIVCAMVTSNENRYRSVGPGDVRLQSWSSFGLPKPSVVRCRRIWSAEPRDLAGRQYGRVTPAVLEAVKEEIRVTVGV